MARKSNIFSRLRKAWRALGPGIVTGASDDDPSGIVTYTQAGAGFGFSTLWTALITFPLMASLQEMSARIGMVSRSGLTTVIRKHYPRWVLYGVVSLTFPAIVFNIGADLAGMGAVANLLVPCVSSGWFSLIFSVIIILSLIYLPYHRIAAVLKYLCVTLLVYIAVPFLVETDWKQVLFSTFIPHIHFDGAFMMTLVGILGTTLSPYLLFWQTTMEAEEMKSRKPGSRLSRNLMRNMNADVGIGMLFSNLIMYFIILAAGTVLFKGGIHQIETVEQAAMALKPLAGNGAYLLFTAGVLGTGFLAIPVLSGALTYMVAETFGIRGGLNSRFAEAPAFYMVMSVSVLLGLIINFLGVSPVRALMYTAVLYGITAPLIVAVVLHIANHRVIMGRHRNKRWNNVLGVFTCALMLFAALVLLWYQF